MNVFEDEFLMEMPAASTVSTSAALNNLTLLLSAHNFLQPDAISRQEQITRDLITYYLTGIVGVTLSCLGIIGNFLSIVVLSRKSMKSSTFCYLLALSCCDFMALLFTAILLGNDLNHSGNTLVDNGILLHMFPYLNPLACTFQVISIWLTLAFTVDRYIMICHPFKAKMLCRTSRARKIIIFLYIAGFAFNFPKFFEYRTLDISIYHPIERTNVTFSVCDLTDFGKNYIFRQLYHFWFYIIVVCGIPFVLLAVLNSCLIHAVLKSREVRKFYNVKVIEKKNDTTIMLIAVVLIFVICQMPALVSRSIWAAQSYQYEFMKTPLFTLNEIANILVVCNSAINIIPYYCFSVRYRRVFLNTFCCCLPHINQPVRIIKRYSFSSSKAYKAYGSFSMDESRKNSTSSPRSSLPLTKRMSSVGILSGNTFNPNKKKHTVVKFNNKKTKRKRNIYIDVFGDYDRTRSTFERKSPVSDLNIDKLTMVHYSFKKRNDSLC